MTAIALKLVLAIAGAIPQPQQPPTGIAFSRTQLHELYVECLEEHDIEPDENDGECDEP